MASDPMDLAYVVIDELAADVADIHVSGGNERDLHLPGIDLLLLSGIAVTSAFFKGLISGVLGGAEQAGEAAGQSLVERFVKLAGRLTRHQGESADATGTGPSTADVVKEFRAAVIDADTALIRLDVAAADLQRYTADAEAEVTASLRELGLRMDRIERIAPSATRGLLKRLAQDWAGRA